MFVVAQLGDGFVTMVTVPDENTKTFLHCQVGIGRSWINYQRTAVTILRQIICMNCDCYLANA